MKNIMLIAVVLAACNTPWSASHAQTISSKDFKAKMGELSNELILDVRTPEEYASGAIPGSVNIDFYSDTFTEKLKLLNKEEPILVYCRSGRRSVQTMEQLNALGFKVVYDLEGGINAWVEAGNETVRPDK